MMKLIECTNITKPNQSLTDNYSAKDVRPALLALMILIMSVYMFVIFVKMLIAINGINIYYRNMVNLYNAISHLSHPIDSKNDLSLLDEGYALLMNEAQNTLVYVPAIPMPSVEMDCQDNDYEPEEVLVSIGFFELTFYCSCVICCGIWSAEHPDNIGTDFVHETASGTELIAGRTIAVDPNVIPFDTEIYITGFGWRTAEDTGSAVIGNIIDIFVGSHDTAHQEALALGRMRNVEVFVRR